MSIAVSLSLNINDTRVCDLISGCCKIYVRWISFEVPVETMEETLHHTPVKDSKEWIDSIDYREIDLNISLSIYKT